MNKPIIIGAGIAGLSAANHLVDNNIAPIIIEADIIGRQKVCGEFFSPEAIPFLQEWGVPLIYINKANFYTPSFNYAFDLPQPAGSVSRNISETFLAQRAINKGAQIYTNTMVTNIIPAQDRNDIHYVKLSTGQIIETNKLIIATGKIPSWNTPKKIPNYIGFKAHFTNVDIANELHMFMTTGAYMGVTYIDDKTINICCLAQKNLVDKYQTNTDFLEQFIKKYHILENLNTSTQLLDWITVSVPNFGKKIIPNWPNTYFVGDAAATIFPASGNGLTMGLTSGIMAAEHIINNMQNDFKKQWNSRYQNRLHYAKILNSLFMNPTYATIGFKMADKLPFISKTFFKLTRE
ncbi:MAG: NAD(P)/FAD-dependent oxidoreductase [Candidatus Babeliales bacterium]|nr:NAD(P)/FAD-dependent oxidoreductase [Candidatus Babeliales bacterium]